MPRRRREWTWVLAVLVSMSLATECMTLISISLTEPMEMLMPAQRVVAGDALDDETAALARDIAGAPPVALAWMKRNIDRASVGRLDDALRDEAQGTVECAATEDHKEAVRAFMEKRPGVFIGR